MKKLYFFFSIWLTGCAITPQNERPVSVYDFGLQKVSSTNNTPGGQQQLSRSLLIAEAKSPVWLNNNAIQYRLAYRDPTQSYTYANSRWAASPATLLTHHIRNSIATTTDIKVLSTSEIVRADFILRLELEEFSQIFDAIDNSHVLIKLRVSLINRSSRLLKAQHSFNVKLAAPTANAAGAVQALAESSDKLTGDLITWLAEELIKTVEEPNT